MTRTLSPCYETNRESRGTHSCFLLRDASAPSQHMTASHLHRSPCANRPSALGPRVAHGTAVHVRSPRGPGSVSCHTSLTDDQGAVSWSMDTGLGGLTFGLRVLSALSIAGGSLARHPLSGGISLPLLLPVVPPQEKSACAGSGEQESLAMTTTQARRAMGARAELESPLPLPG